MNKKIKILFVNADQAGVFYWRTQLPALMIQEKHSDDFDVTIKHTLEETTLEELKTYDIVHFHQSLHGDNQTMKQIFDDNGIVSIIDLDDNPRLHPTHPMYHLIKTEKRDELILNGLKYADAVSTTTPYFLNVLKQYNKNIEAFQNAATEEIAPQFFYKRKSSDKIRVGYIGGSSHLKDIEQLTGLFQLFSSTPDLQDKITMSLHGFDLRGTNKMTMINQDLINELNQRLIPLSTVFNEFNKSFGDINKMSTIPSDLKEKYKTNFVQIIEEPLKPEQNVWIMYEKIFTDKYKLIKNDDYKQHLFKYQDVEFDGDLSKQPYLRYFTKPINSYMKHYDNIDVALVPLVNNEFNHCKSPLKLAECLYKRVLPIVSNNPLYTQYIKHGENGFVAKDERDFEKIIKRIAREPQIIEEMTTKFVESVKDEFDLVKVTQKRVDWYKKLLVDKRK